LISSNKKVVRNEIKIPVFSQREDIRSILEYHELSQIWVLENDSNETEKLLENIIKFSVDILIINLSAKPNALSKNLIYDKFEFRKYEISKFYGPNLLIKILLDKFLSLVFILILCPILLISSILIFLEDGFPILFTQDRTGWDGRRFKIFKLRTLNKKKFDKTTQVTINDKRKLICGSFIRKFSIDEVPQLFNVLRGDMSIVGPRPHMVEHDIKYSKLFMNYLKRHKCNPGLTGWAQVNGLRGSTSDEQMKKRMDHDLWYLNNWNNTLDIYIILKTFYVIFKYKGE
jgi:putative colanic acid biosynthesis UDP-glucose lipid carrier transferase